MNPPSSQLLATISLVLDEQRRRLQRLDEEEFVLLLFLRFFKLRHIKKFYRKIQANKRKHGLGKHNKQY